MRVLLAPLKLPVEFITLPGSKHGGSEFYDDERTQIMETFLRTHLKQP